MCIQPQYITPTINGSVIHYWISRYFYMFYVTIKYWCTFYGNFGSFEHFLRYEESLTSWILWIYHKHQLTIKKRGWVINQSKIFVLLLMADRKQSNSDMGELHTQNIKMISYGFAVSSLQEPNIHSLNHSQIICCHKRIILSDINPNKTFIPI